MSARASQRKMYIEASLYISWFLFDLLFCFTLSNMVVTYHDHRHTLAKMASTMRTCGDTLRKQGVLAATATAVYESD